MKRLIIFLFSFMLAMLAVMALTIYLDRGRSVTPQLPAAEQTSDISTLLERLPVLQQQALEGEAESQFWLGLSYAVGWGVPRDFQLADYYLQAARDAKYQRADAVIAMMYFSGIGRDVDYDKWREHTELSGMLGDEITADSAVQFLLICQQEARERYDACQEYYGETTAIEGLDS